MYSLPTPAPPVDLYSFMNRPYWLATLTWVASDAVGSVKWENDFPAVCLQVFPTLRKKMDQIAYWKPDIELEFLVNGTKFHYGRLLVVSQPWVRNRSLNYIKYSTATTWPQWYQISASSQQSVKMRIPYRHIQRRIPINNSYKTNNSWGTVRIYCSAPLENANTIAPSPVTVQILFRIIPRFEGFAPENAAYVPLEPEVPLVAQSAENEILNNVTQGVSTLFHDLGTTTVKCEEMLGSVSAVAKDISVLPALAGMSVGPNPGLTASMQIRQPLFIKSEDTPNAVNLGPSINARTQLDYRLVNGYPGEMDIVEIVKQPCMINSFNITSVFVPLDVLWSMHLNPMDMIYGGMGWTPGRNEVAPSAAYYIARMFELWRGSFNIHISFVASAVHSGRYALTWHPTTNNVDTPTLARETLTDAYTVIMDINKQTEYSIRIPYFQTSEWRRVKGTYTSDVEVSTNGMLKLAVVNRLSSVLPTPTPIFCQIFMSMCDDAQFAAPTLVNAHEIYGNPYYADPPTEEDEEPDLRSRSNIYKGFVAQSSERMVMGTDQLSNSGECEFPSSSAACLRNTKYASITGLDTPLYRLAGESTAYEFTSVKQLSNLLSGMETDISITSDFALGRSFAPFGNADGVPYNSSAWFNYYMQIRGIFMFGRGSMRYNVISDRGGNQASATLLPVLYPVDNGIMLSQTFDPLRIASTQPYQSQGYQNFTNLDLMPADIIIPYYDTNPCHDYTEGSIPTDHNQATAANLTLNTGGVAGVTVMFSSATGDDFIFGLRCGMPILKHIDPPT